MAHHTHEHRDTDLREPRPSKSRTGVAYESQRWGPVWVERRVTKPLQLNEGLEGREERDDDAIH